MKSLLPTIAKDVAMLGDLMEERAIIWRKVLLPCIFNKESISEKFGAP